MSQFAGPGRHPQGLRGLGWQHGWSAAVGLSCLATWVLARAHGQVPGAPCGAGGSLGAG